MAHEQPQIRLYKRIPLEKKAQAISIENINFDVNRKANVMTGLLPARGASS
ncbi:MAG TPA: hypothetical protein PLZ11_01460 [Thauera sp.]|uniref:hypothetical protein n=1 Tax=Thauera sp. WB-2 TaxID=2897772 RepID=UPI0022DDA84B|nr:hypothetical protein [Thauera sp. WB-2]WBL64168.1 hypothetical protein LQF09_19220 [Thauera sp. WB-2]HRJ22580.1 hypothetical protein [Thauera sp.]